MELPQLINKRDELKKSLFNDKYDDSVKVLEELINQFEINLNSLFISQSCQRKKIAKNLETDVMVLLKNLGEKFPLNVGGKFSQINRQDNQ